MVNVRLKNASAPSLVQPPGAVPAILGLMRRKGQGEEGQPEVVGVSACSEHLRGSRSSGLV